METKPPSRTNSLGFKYHSPPATQESPWVICPLQSLPHHFLLYIHWNSCPRNPLLLVSSSSSHVSHNGCHCAPQWCFINPKMKCSHLILAIKTNTSKVWPYQSCWQILTFTFCPDYIEPLLLLPHTVLQKATVFLFPLSSCWEHSSSLYFLDNFSLPVQICRRLQLCRKPCVITHHLNHTTLTSVGSRAIFWAPKTPWLDLNESSHYLFML